VKEAILQFLQANDDATFGTLAKEIPGFDGDYAMYVRYQGESRVLWPSLSPEASESIRALVQARRIHVVTDDTAVARGLEFVPVELAGSPFGAILPAVVRFGPGSLEA